MMKFLVFLLVVIVSDLKAETAYRWNDSKGRVVYGTKPPKNSSSAEKIKLKKLSTYSEDKVLKRMGKVPESKQEKKPEFDISKTKNNINKNRGANRARSEVSEIMLTSDLAELKFDDDGFIVDCRVKIRNTSKKNAFEISVAFEFSDKLLIPAVGPFELEEGRTAYFFIPQELLPLDIKLGKLTGDFSQNENKSEQYLPKVIVHSLGSK